MLTHESDVNYAHLDHRRCALPQYIPLCAAFSFLAVSVFLRLPILIKSLLIVFMGTIFALYIELSHISIFECFDDSIR